MPEEEYVREAAEAYAETYRRLGRLVGEPHERDGRYELDIRQNGAVVRLSLKLAPDDGGSGSPASTPYI